MKFLNCLMCHDVVLLRESNKFKLNGGRYTVCCRCICGESLAWFDDDHVTLYVYGESARIMGLGNNEYFKSVEWEMNGSLNKDNLFTWNICKADGVNIHRVKNNHGEEKKFKIPPKLIKELKKSKKSFDILNLKW